MTETTTSPAVKVTRDLAEIIDLSVQLLTQAVHDANAQIDGTSLPGGRAMVALANVGDTDTFERRVEMAERAWFARLEASGSVQVIDGISVRVDDTRPVIADLEDDDTAPALQILRYWSEKYRWELGMVWDHIPTLNTEARFLAIPDVLAHVAAHHADEWPHMARDINRARRHLESILYAGRRPDTSRVVCDNDACEDPKQLIKVYGPTFTTAWECPGCATTVPETRACTSCHRAAAPSAATHCRRMVGKKDDRRPCDGELVSTVVLDHCPNPWCFTVASAQPVLASDPTTDRWKCTSCKTRFNDEAYGEAHAAMLRKSGAQRFVNVRDAIATLIKQGRPEVTVRSWLQPPRRHVADRCTICRRRWAAEEYNVCPGTVEGSLEKCGGELKPVRRGNANHIIEAYCDIATHTTYIWWPDIWKRHLATKAKAERAAARKLEQEATTRAEAETA